MLDPTALPEEIRETERAVVWKREERDGKPTKVPYRPGRPNEYAKVSDPETWGAFEDALRNTEDGKADGAGFVLGDGIVGIDLDDCRDPETGELEPWAAKIVDRLDSYTEVSPSGTGVHIIARGALPDGRRRKGPVEMYSDGRYFTVTGDHLEGTPQEIRERTAELAALHAEMFETNGDGGDAGVSSEPPARDLNLSDRQLIEKAKSAKNGDTFARLWAGDTSGYPSQSEADLALCSILAFWTRGDAGRIDNLFRQSGLMRDKWKREDYRERTIGRALEGRTEYWEPEVGDRADALLRGEPDPAPAEGDPFGLELPEAVPAADALEEEPPSFLVEGLVLENEPGIIIGEGGVYKTTLALTVAGAVATGEPLFDRFEVQESGPVLFVSEEDGGGVLRNRLEATARGHGWDVETALRNVHLLALKGATLDDEEWRDHIAEEVERIGAVLVVLDPYSRLTRAAENSTDENKENIAFMSRLNREGVTVSLVHHAGKDFEGKSKLDRVRGASAINQAARWIHFLERSDLGVAVECLKMSRAERPDRFVVEPDIETDPAEPTVWKAASFQYVTEDQAEEDAADEFILENLRRYPGTNSTGLKELAKGTGISAVEVSAAIRRLETVGKIEYEPGPRNAKEWHTAEDT